MRENKYRAWNKEHDCFFYFCNGRYYNSEDLSRCISERICFEFKWSNAEQYTGKEDKNGKEIYEGDIVRSIYPDNNIIYFDQLLAMYCFNHKSTYGESTCALYRHIEDTEIISNIHENKELA